MPFSSVFIVDVEQVNVIWVASLENCLDKWLAEDNVQGWKCRNFVNKLIEAVSELRMIQLKRFRKIENSCEKILSQLNSLLARQWQEAEIEGREFEGMSMNERELHITQEAQYWVTLQRKCSLIKGGETTIM